MTGKEKCEMLRSIRRQIAEANGIVYMEAECGHEGDCLGTCPKCDAQIRYLDAELNRKIASGEKVTVSGLSVDAFEKILKNSTSTDETSSENGEDNEISDVSGSNDESDEEYYDTSSRQSMGGLLSWSRGNPLDIEDLDLSVRSCNCLRRAGIYTVEALCDRTPEDLMKVRRVRIKPNDFKRRLSGYPDCSYYAFF